MTVSRFNRSRAQMVELNGLFLSKMDSDRDDCFARPAWPDACSSVPDFRVQLVSENSQAALALSSAALGGTRHVSSFSNPRSPSPIGVNVSFEISFRLSIRMRGFFFRYYGRRRDASGHSALI